MTETKQSQFGTALVLGGCGYLGCHTVEALHADGSFPSIVAASRNPRRWHIAEAVYKSCDIADAAQVGKLLDEVQPAVQYRINYSSTKHVLEIARGHAAVRAFIYTGSARSIASESHTQSTPLTEDTAILHNISSNGVAYERTKGAADALTREMNTPNKSSTTDGFKGVLHTAVMRVPGLYGRRDFRTSARILKRTNTRATHVQLGNNNTNHEWLYFDNAAYAHVLAAKALLDDRPRAPNMKMWAAAGDKGCTDLSTIKVIPMGLVVAVATVIEWALWIFTLNRVKTSLSAAQLRYIDGGSWWSIEKARERLDYEPICETDEDVRRTVEWL
ncbi:hypothetical protein GQ44DRAFT_775015 [Phaeosphaeriaceae sp. PMI808]|nr:hypothetical protein GQ44DRAFT_775015 [Phaeosphaeriaceae sp. PMI808]